MAKLAGRAAELLEVVEANIETAGEAFVRSSATPALMSRRADYESLRTLLLLTRGRFELAASLSPVRFLTDVVQPLASWWLRHQARHFATAHSQVVADIGAALTAAAALLATTPAQLCAGTDAMVRGSDDFLDHLTRALQVL